MKRIKIIYIVVILFLLLSCNSKVRKFSERSVYEYDFDFERYEPYLSVDSIYKTKDEKLKFDSLKKHFLKIWLKPYDYDENKLFRIKFIPRPDGFKDEVDPDICYYNGSGNSFGDFCIRKVYIDNILHTSFYDTLLFFVITDEAIIDSNNNVKTDIVVGKKHNYETLGAKLIKVVIMKDNSWQFICNPMLFGVDGQPEMLFEVRRGLKRAVIKCSYFKADLSVDSTFWHRLFTESKIYFPDPRKDGFPLH